MNIIKKMGPGLLFAGAAIGVSHLVQSTTAGANYGLTLVIAVILANVLKFPIFEFAVRYANVKQESLIEGYRRLGKWAIILFGIITLGTMFGIQAAVTVVTAGLFEEVTGWGNSTVWSIIILVVCGLILGIGKYKFLDTLIKYIIVVLSLTTIIAVTVALIENPLPGWGSFSFSNEIHIAFLLSLVGWMPAPFDLSVWQSMWVVEKLKLGKGKISLRDSLFDFNTGYWATMFLAMGFLLLGALILFGSEEKVSPVGAVFARQVIGIFTKNLGDWAYPIVGLAAITTMVSTVITCLDAFPRVLTTLRKEPFRHPVLKGRNGYWFFMILVSVGAVIFISYLTSTMGQMVKIATIISFLTAPIIAVMNYMLVFRKDFPVEHRPNLFMKYLSWVGIFFLTGFGVYYLYMLI